MSSGSFICVLGVNFLKNPPSQLPPLSGWAARDALDLLLLSLLDARFVSADVGGGAAAGAEEGGLK